MILEPMVQWIVFGLFSSVAIAGAVGMATTMSMFRSGIFLMGSFIGVAGLFILLSADLLGLLQIMMYIGGMLVMILFMVLFSHDPGRSMTAGMMKLSLMERLFSLGLTGRKERQDHGKHEPGGQLGGHGNGRHKQDKDMDMSGMSMTTPLKRLAAGMGICIALLLAGLLLFRPAWPVSHELPDPQSAYRVGSLLMDKYMIAFEGAGLLILIGIFGAVLMARSGHVSGRTGRDEYVSENKPPPGIVEE